MKVEELKNRFDNAVRLEKDGHLQKASEEYLAIIELDRNHRESFFNLGSIYSRLNRIDDALRCFKKAIAISEDYIAYFNIGSIYYKTSQYKKAILNLEKAKRLNPDFAMSFLVAGLSFSRMKNIKAAESNFADVLKTWPNNKVALTALVIIFYNSSRFNEAIDYLNRLIEIDSSNLKYREIKSDILYKAGCLEDYADELKSVKKISDGYKLYDEFISSVPVEAYNDKYGTIDEKIETLSKKEDNFDSMISLSLCHLFKGDTDSAIDYLMKAKKSL